MKPVDKKIYLASKSPRRRELLRQIGVDFELLLLRSDGPRGADVTEEVNPNEDAYTYVGRVAMEKAECAWNMLQRRHLVPRPVLAADTTVTIDGAILGKPANTAEAIAMLEKLSGRTHQVMTAIAVKHTRFEAQITQVSDVRFGELTPASIQAYCATGEPYDKAGGYGIQGLASVFIEHIEGSHSGIMGLPIYETAKLLRQAGLPLP
ncbi:Maf family protein [Pseudoduganella ginsengisoli]|uniref:dTTP/UTP pyrophosphatase n=1 Tax=Pseudoduganella ginsengisoli TaxID=1462440 RepID=A0A6L6PTL7_9BURK|nr:Maf family protein [Pseudoduganella ginsengisoli]MTW00777.1 septum formation inhibitor Maf [Pseudoduganella ginsengisoli]